LVKSKKQSQLPAPELPATSAAGSEELLQEVANLAALPTPPVPVEIKTQPLVEPEIEGDEPTNVMQFAFKNLRRSK
jgi:hypothetical protein